MGLKKTFRFGSGKRGGPGDTKSALRALERAFSRSSTASITSLTFLTAPRGAGWARYLRNTGISPRSKPQPPEALSLRAVTAFLSDVAPGLPADIADQTRQRLSKINDDRAPIGLPSDLSFLTMKSQSIEDARLRAQRAVVIMDFLDRVAPSGDRSDGDDPAVEKFATQCRNAYSNAALNGTLYAPLLLLLEIVEAAKPTWPFGAGRPRFVCGQIPCNHRICNENIRDVQSKSLRDGSSQAMAARDVHAYLLANEAGLVEILSSVIGWRGGTWIEQAAGRLLSRGDTERMKLAQARTVPDFYTLHFRFMPSFKAAQLGFEFLASRAPAGTETRAKYESQMTEADEGGTRSAGALVFDFLNSIDLTPLARLRATYGSIAEQSSIAANSFLQKWIRDETLIPPFWSDYVAGKSEGSPAGAATIIRCGCIPVAFGAINIMRRYGVEEGHGGLWAWPMAATPARRSQDHSDRTRFGGEPRLA